VALSGRVSRGPDCASDNRREPAWRQRWLSPAV